MKQVMIIKVSYIFKRLSLNYLADLIIEMIVQIIKYIKTI